MIVHYVTVSLEIAKCLDHDQTDLVLFCLPFSSQFCLGKKTNILFVGIFIIYISFNQLYTDGLIQCYMLDDSIFHFRVAGSILSPLFYF